MLFEADLVTYHGLYKTIQTEKLNIPAIDGRRTILSNHMPIMVPIELGVIETVNNGVLSHYAVSDGMVYFENNKATVVCDVIEDLADVDVDYYENRIKDANEKLSIARTDGDIKKASIQLARATNIINAAKKVRH